MNTDELKRRLQGHFTDGLVTIIGSGHSAAFGLPTMPEIANVLDAEMPDRVPPGEDDWQLVADALGSGADLETALDLVPNGSPVIPQIVVLTAETILQAELEAINAIMTGRARLALTELIPHLAVAGSASILTTNYDRIIELAVELAGFALDRTFVGEQIGRFDVDAARHALRSNAVKRKTTVRFVYRHHVRLRKPHGSLDWYMRDDAPIRCSHTLELPRLMITPGATKYLQGYDQPFDRHRELANHDIDAAARFLTIGYGFNDPHLQTHLEPRIRDGVPTLVLARTLTDAARALVSETTVIATERVDDGMTAVYIDGARHEVPIADLWKVDGIIDEVLT